MVISHIQRIASIANLNTATTVMYYCTVVLYCSCCLLSLFLTFSALVANPKKLLYTVANPARGLLNRGKKEKEKVWQRPPPSPRAVRSEKKKDKKKSRDASTYISRRYASRRYAGGLGPSCIRTWIPTTRQLGQWVPLHKTRRLRVRLQLSQSRCLSLLLAMSGRIFLFLPPRGHEPPPILRDRLNPTLSLYRHRFPIRVLYVLTVPPSSGSFWEILSSRIRLQVTSKTL